jgi:asparagine synthase (glutamine-hydrolysing)
MSGIGAIFHRDNSPVSSVSVERMTAALRLYGPVKQVHRVYDNFGLSWTRAGFFTPDDKYDQQPVSPGGRMPMVFSGLLQHREELAAKLGLTRDRFKSMADSALAHMAWLKWGRELSQHLYGDFSILLCDRERNQIFAIRSAGAATPIFYHESRSRLIFGSAPKAIFAIGDIPRELNEQRLADSMILNNQDVENSFYKDIKSVPLGHILEAGPDFLRLECHTDWSNTKEIRFARDEDYVEAANEIFDRSIASHMRAIRTPAAMLSSGLDSSSVVAAALEYLDKQKDKAEGIISFTSVPAPGWDGTALGQLRAGDESGPVRAFAAMYPQLDARFVDSANLPIDHDLEKMILLSETPPFGIKNLHWFINLQRLAMQEGRNVMLGGDSGNRTLSFSGQSIYAKLLRQGRWLKLWRELRGSDNRNKRFMGLYRRAIRPNLPGKMVQQIGSFTGSLGHAGWTRHSAVNPDYAGDMRLDDRAKEMGFDTSYSGFTEGRELMRHMGGNGTRELGQTTGYALEALTGVQRRDPLGDRKLVEFCMGIPEEQFMRNGEDRRLIKRMMASRLPPEILNAKRGRQAADWHMRMTRDLPRYKQEIERLADDPEMQARFDVPRLLGLLDNWPDKTPRSLKDHPDAGIAGLGLPRAIATSRFINWVKGKN